MIEKPTRLILMTYCIFCANFRNSKPKADLITKFNSFGLIFNGNIYLRQIFYVYCNCNHFSVRLKCEVENCSHKIVNMQTEYIHNENLYSNNEYNK